MSQPFHVLKHEHRVIERALRALDGICVRLSGGEDVPAEVLSETTEFLKSYVDGFHHSREEAGLFAALDERIGQRDSALAHIAQEHEIERRLLATMLRAVDESGKGGMPSKAIFVEAAQKYTQHLTAHMEVEEAGFFKLADEVLDEPDKQALVAQFHSNASNCSAERYVKLAAELEEKWAL